MIFLKELINWKKNKAIKLNDTADYRIMMSEIYISWAKLPLAENIRDRKQIQYCCL